MIRTPTSTAPAPPSQLVVERIAEREGCSPVELEPLYSAVDPDALDSLVGPDGRTGVDVTFTYHGYAVTATGEGELHIEPDTPSEPASP